MEFVELTFIIISRKMQDRDNMLSVLESYILNNPDDIAREIAEYSTMEELTQIRKNSKRTKAYKLMYRGI